MSFPLITCPLCGSQVSKRSTILVEPYGRICRNHPEVEQHKEKLVQLAAKATMDATMATMAAVRATLATVKAAPAAAPAAAACMVPNMLVKSSEST